MQPTIDRSVRIAVTGALLLTLWSVVLPAAEIGDSSQRVASTRGISPADPDRIGELLSDSTGSMDEFVFRNGPPIHRYLGYATFAGAMGTGLLGWLDPESDVHGPLAYATTGLAAATTGAGIITYARDRDLPLGHIVLSGLGTLGFAANLFIDADEDEDGGEDEDDEDGGTHQILGTAATAAFALSVVWVIAF